VEAETTDKYTPEPGNKVSWKHSRSTMGRVKGEVDYTEGEIAAVFIPPSKTQNGEEHSRRTRYMKPFDQLTLLERPES
jgi:hypothetical protein